MHKSIPIRKDDSEIFAYDYPDFPAYAQACRISSCPRYRAATHWHEDKELVFIREGEIIYEVNGEAMLLRAGEGICVNFRHHRAALCFRTFEPFGHALLRAEKQLRVATENSGANAENIHTARVRPVVFADTGKVSGNMGDAYGKRSSASQTTKKEAEKLDVLKAILRFLYAHYAEHITLKIAQGGNVGKIGWKRPQSFC